MVFAKDVTGNLFLPKVILRPETNPDYVCIAGLDSCNSFDRFPLAGFPIHFSARGANGPPPPYKPKRRGLSGPSQVEWEPSLEWPPS